MGFIEGITGIRRGSVNKYSPTEYILFTRNLNWSIDSIDHRRFKNNEEAVTSFYKEADNEFLKSLTFAVLGLAVAVDGVRNLDNMNLGVNEIAIGLLLWRIGMDHIHRFRLAGAALREAKK